MWAGAAVSWTFDWNWRIHVQCSRFIGLARWCPLLARGIRCYPHGLFPGLLLCPQSMTAGFLQSKQSKWPKMQWLLGPSLFIEKYQHYIVKENVRGNGHLGENMICWSTKHSHSYPAWNCTDKSIPCFSHEEIETQRCRIACPMSHVW